LVTPGWSDPKIDKLPYYGLPEDLTGKRVLDIGPAEGFFSFEAEKRGAREVIAIDPIPVSVRRFNICKDALGSKVNIYMTNVYDLSPKTFGTFDMVFFFGVLYHLRHPLLALERIMSVCTGTMLMQTATCEDSVDPQARFFPFGLPSGPKEAPIYDPTVFWLPNRECVKAMVQSSGFVNPQVISTNDFISISMKAQSPVQQRGEAPDENKAPWS
jgi:tRNA (mo5U34)-methyltransferase